MDRLYTVEGEIGERITGLSGKRTRAASLARLGEYNSVVKAFYRDLPPELADAMRHADQRYGPK